MNPKVLAYYFPNWHTDVRNEEWFGPGWDEWTLLRSAQPRFPGHRPPLQPTSGEFDEADPHEMAKQIDLASSAGIDGFAFDFYWYTDGPFLQRALDDGFLGAHNSHKLEFSLMWANHDYHHLFPAEPGVGSGAPLASANLSRKNFDEMARHIVENYFSQPHYLRVDGKPFFSIYEIGSLIDALGSERAVIDALDAFEETARRAGHPGIHFDAVIWGFEMLPGTAGHGDASELATRIGFSSATSYVWIHHIEPSEHEFPLGDWDQVADDAFKAYYTYARAMKIPFYPNVTAGWDSSARASVSVPFEPGPYPWLPVFQSTPEQFRRGLERARQFLDDTKPDNPMVFVNAWNEWTEGSVLLPTTLFGSAYLDAIREVFGEH